MEFVGHYLKDNNLRGYTLNTLKNFDFSIKRKKIFHIFLEIFEGLKYMH